MIDPRRSRCENDRIAAESLVAGVIEEVALAVLVALMTMMGEEASREDPDGRQRRGKTPGN